MEYLNPPGLRKNPAFTWVVAASGPTKTIYIGAIDSGDASGAIVGKGDIAAQTEQVFKNLEAALAGAGARLEHIVHWRIYIAEGQSARAAGSVFLRVWGTRPNPPANTIVYVAALEPRDFLIAIDAVAVVPL
jgi:enamine deaminase RidA (YjgF/YER057c/UK114 family)